MDNNELISPESTPNQFPKVKVVKKAPGLVERNAGKTLTDEGKEILKDCVYF